MEIWAYVRSSCLVQLGGFDCNRPQHTHTWSSLQITRPWCQTILTDVCQKSCPRRRLEHRLCPEIASSSTVTSFEGTERNHKGLPEDLGQAGTDAPLRIDCLPLLQRDSCHVTGFCEECCDDLFASASQCLEFHRRSLTWKRPC